jgi:chemotaxis protein MotB
MIPKNKKNKFPIPPTLPSSSNWLVSYADMMTLIACFFILMMAFANFDPVGFTKKTQEIARHFNKDKFKSSDSPFKKIEEEVAIHPELEFFTKTSINDNELLITFSGTVLFPENNYKLSDELLDKVDTLIKIIKTYDPNFRILIEGHTDNQTLSESSPFKSLWELSAMRSAQVAARFEFFGFDPKHIVSIGLADTKPLKPNEDEKGEPLEENMKFNRRISIKVLERVDPSKQKKLGLGAYFSKDNK